MTRKAADLRSSGADDLLTLSYYGSRCRDRAEVDVDESPTRVVLTVRETVRARSCDTVAIRYPVDVRLDAPLADRELVDGACRIPRFADDSECATSQSTVQSKPS